MKIFLFRHGKSDKSLKEKLPHNEFELKRELVAGEAEKAQAIGKKLNNSISSRSIDLVFSGKTRSKQTVIALAEGLGLSPVEIRTSLREDFGLIYLTTQDYWERCENSVESGEVDSHADYFLQNDPDSRLTFSAQDMRNNMRLVIKRAIDRNRFLSIETSIMVSHEPVISLCISDLFGQSVADLGGSSHELEYAEFLVEIQNDEISRIELKYRDQSTPISI